MEKDEKEFKYQKIVIQVFVNNKFKGTGFVISEDGYVLTNRHLLEDTNKKIANYSEISIKYSDKEEHYICSKIVCSKIDNEPNVFNYDYAILYFSTLKKDINKDELLKLNYDFKLTTGNKNLNYDCYGFGENGCFPTNFTATIAEQVGSNNAHKLHIKGDTREVNEGDSGSPIFDLQNNEIIGMLFARNENNHYKAYVFFLKDIPKFNECQENITKYKVLRKAILEILPKDELLLFVQKNKPVFYETCKNRFRIDEYNSINRKVISYFDKNNELSILENIIIKKDIKKYEELKNNFENNIPEKNNIYSPIILQDTIIKLDKEILLDFIFDYFYDYYHEKKYQNENNIYDKKKIIIDLLIEFTSEELSYAIDKEKITVTEGINYQKEIIKENNNRLIIAKKTSETSIDNNLEKIVDYIRENKDKDRETIKIVLDYKGIQFQKEFLQKFSEIFSLLADEAELIFANRKKELEKIQMSSKIYYLLFASAGYGKTYLLKKLNEAYKNERYDTYLINLPVSFSNEHEFYCFIRDKFLFYNNEISSEYFNDTFEYYFRGKLKDRKNNILILFDHFENILTWDEKLKLKFTNILYGLEELIYDFKIKIIFASKIKDLELPLNISQKIEIISLSKFGNNEISEAVELYTNAKVKIETIKEYSKIIENYSGGHIDVISYIILVLQKYNFPNKIDFFSRNTIKKDIENKITNIIYKIFINQPDKFIFAIKKVSVFRLFNRGIIRKIIIENCIQEYTIEEFDNLWTEIMSTKLYSLSSGYYKDDIVRYLLSKVFLREAGEDFAEKKTKKNKFEKINNIAITFFAELYSKKEDIRVTFRELFFHLTLKYKVINHELDFNNYVKLDIIKIFNKNKQHFCEDFDKQDFIKEMQSKILEDNDISELWNEKIEKINEIFKILKNGNYEK